ncbi:MAG: chromate transporter [Anaerolineaceae bacterium]
MKPPPRLGWVTPEEFADGVAVGNALPGPIAPQVSAFIGYKMAGTAGAVVAVIGTVVPATILMLVMVTFFFGIKDSPTMKAILGGLRPVVVGLLIWTAYDIARSVFDAESKGWGTALLTGWDKDPVHRGHLCAVKFFTRSTRSLSSWARPGWDS